jgi:N-methylhydantoinase B
MPNDPCNAGHAMCLDYELPRRSVINPEWPAPTDSYGYVVECLMELMFRCFVRIIPERCPAGGYQLTGGFITRTQAEYGEPFVMADPVHGGNGATYDGDGPTNQLTGNGDLPNSPVEVMETRHPVLINRVEFAPETAGIGRFRGGFGVRKDYLILGDGCFVSLVTENTTDVTAKGVDGAGNGKPGHFIINPGKANEQFISKRISGIGPFDKGTVLRVVTGGGGGWGSARERDANLVLHDIRNGLLDPDAAEKIYGVAVMQEATQWVVNEARTRELRME